MATRVLCDNALILTYEFDFVYEILCGDNAHPAPLHSV